MADRHPQVGVDEAGLERALRDLGSAIAYPRARNLAPIVGARLRRETMANAGRRFRVPTLPWSRVRLAIVVAAALLALFAAAVAAGVLGLPGIQILLTGTPPARPTPSASIVAPASASAPASVRGALGQTLELGREIDPDQLDAAAGRHVPVLDALGRPDSAWLDTSGGVPLVSLVWRASAALPESPALATRERGVGAVLTAIPATIDGPLLQKLAGPGTSVDAITIGGRPGFWIGGAPHELLLLARDGSVISSATRLAGNSLLWTADGLTLRLESSLEREPAIALAESAR